MKAYKLLAIALLATVATLPAHAKYDDGVGKAGIKDTAIGATCDHEAKGKGVNGAKYEQRIHDCNHHGSDAVKGNSSSHRKQMLDGNHKLQWQQGYTQ